MLFLYFILGSVSCIVELSAQQDEGAYNLLPLAIEALGNFSIELMYHTSVFRTGSFIISPFNTWEVLAATADGALSTTRAEIHRALRISKNRNLTRFTISNLSWDLSYNTTAIEFARFNAMLIDKSKGLLQDFKAFSKMYDTFTIPVNLTNAETTASRTNKAVSVATHGLIRNMVDENDFGEPQMVITSAAYFKGRWTAAFDSSSTSKQPFYDSNGVKTGEVNMMYNRFMYPLVEIDGLKASVIELPFGSDRELSMLVMLPYKGVSLKEMVTNFQKVPLDVVYSELKLDQQEHGNDVIECLIPRFELVTKLELKEVVKKLGVHKMFDDKDAALGRLARFPMHVTKVIHKNVIKVTEDGVTGPMTAPKATPGIPKFEANRPFMFLVISKPRNIIAFVGLYQEPQLY